MVESTVPVADVAKQFTAAGRVVAPDGSPVEGALVNVKGLPFERIVARWTRSDARGNFRLPYSSLACVQPTVSYGDSDYWFDRDANRSAEPCEVRWQNPRDIVMPMATRLNLKITGADPTAARAYWWHDSFGWQRFSSLQPWISLGGFTGITIKVEADGFVPLMQIPKLPRIDASKGEKPPDEIPIEFAFNNGQRQLSIRGDGKALADVAVDVEWIEHLDSDHRGLSGVYRTAADGRVALKGGQDQLLEVFVYAEGYEPRRAIWNPGAPLVLDLAPRNSTFSFAPTGSARIARIRDVAVPQAVRTLLLNANDSRSLKTASGTYDVTQYGERGAVLSYQRIQIRSGETKAVDSSADQRPHLAIRYPAEGWRAMISDSSPRGSAAGWAAMIAVNGSLAFADLPAAVDHQSAREESFFLSGAGRMHVELRRPNQTQSLWRDIDVRPGESITLNAPATDSVLKGSIRTYDGGLGMSIHGWAGPRMQLISDEPTGWSVTEYLPARDSRTGEEKDRFTIQSLPAGNYHLYQHLIGTPTNYTYGGKEIPYTEPIAAWGGIPLKLESGHTTLLNDFIEYAFADLQVRMRDRAGQPIENGTLRIRDRMSDSWRQVEENPAQLEQAAHPIPYPAAVRVIQGRATLPRVREGALELLLELDTGQIYSFMTSVGSSRELLLGVPVN